MIGFAAVGAAVLVGISGAVGSLMVQRMIRSVEELANVQEPLERATLEMEINAQETSRAVLDYVRAQEPRFLDRIQDSERDFERYAAQYDSLAATQEQQRLGERVATRYQNFAARGDEITRLAEQRTQALASFRILVNELDELVDVEFQAPLDRSAPGALAKIEAALDMEINIDEAFSALDGILSLSGDPTAPTTLIDAQGDFARHLAEYRTTGLTASARTLVDQVDEDFATALTAGNDVVALSIRLDGVLVLFEQEFVAIDEVLDDVVQPLILAETQRAEEEARRSGAVAVSSVLAFGVIVLIILGFGGWVVSKRVSLATGKLSEGATEFARGNLAHRIELPTKDELGGLATAFNEMAEQNRQHQANLERLVDERTAALTESEERLRDMNVELESIVDDRTEQLVAANTELEAFAYSVSHDLKAPLRAIDGYSGMLEESVGSSIPEDAQRLLKVVRESTQQMGSLIEDLLEFARIGRSEITISKVDMRELVQTVFTDLMRFEGERAVDFSLAQLPTVSADPSLFRHVWINLLQNALKFSQDREVTRIQVDCREEPEHWVFWVRDNGAGFDMTYIDKLFGVFQRLHYQEEFPGTGVGLATVKRIVHRHGGEVWAEAKVDEGALIFFRLPRTEEAT